MKYLACSIIMIASLWSQTTKAETVFHCFEKERYSHYYWRDTGSLYSTDLGRFVMKVWHQPDHENGVVFSDGGFPQDGYTHDFLLYEGKTKWTASITSRNSHYGHYVFALEGENLFGSQTSGNGVKTMYATCHRIEDK